MILSDADKEPMLQVKIKGRAKPVMINIGLPLLVLTSMPCISSSLENK